MQIEQHNERVSVLSDCVETTSSCSSGRLTQNAPAAADGSRPKSIPYRSNTAKKDGANFYANDSHIDGTNFAVLNNGLYNNSRGSEDPQIFAETASLVNFLNLSSRGVALPKPICPETSNIRIAPRPESVKHHEVNVSSARTRCKKRISDENSQIHVATKRQSIDNSSENSTGIDLRWGNDCDTRAPPIINSHKALTVPTLGIGEDSKMLARVAEYVYPAEYLSYKYTDIPPATLSHREFIHDPMFNCNSANQRYTQVLIWCLSRRMTGLAKHGCTSHGMRLTQVLGSLRTKMRDGVLRPFEKQDMHLAPLKLKPTQINPKQEHNVKALQEFTEFYKQLESNKREGISILLEAETQISRASCTATTISTATVTHIERDQMREMRAAVESCLRDLAARSLVVENIAESVRELISDLQNRYFEARYDHLDAGLRSRGP